MLAATASPQLPNAIVAASALGWLVDCGLDAVVDATPRNWLAERPTPATEALTVRPEPLQAPAPVQHAPAALALDDLDSLAALDAALVAIDHPLGRRSAAPPRLLTVADNAPLLLLGEVPLPDNGDERRLLAAMLAAIGIELDTVSVAALLPWSTPGNRPARADEVDSFLPFLRRSLALAPQRCILALGQRAGQLAVPDAPLAALRGRALALEGVPMLTTYPPAMLLRQPALKADAWADLQRLQALLEGTA
ncbi:hypothetical protein GCM10007973_21080 [Polymorphobacter multimanifer]|uniref:DNA polymerase n=1 Tax=Polymorphobacter multimanifer TaxID=1070431 RepID=A0A841L0E0_9SPHN|nr:uracil-DNA glycosylase [Polymorphobacter multimanifer]MBB6226004.1 DNA polymerase [Polymorphobacter multimanifer]GGI84335.1 hypothetical protein GCM10007973_21080 [Polymorphobacter multimanifer]